MCARCRRNCARARPIPKRTRAAIAAVFANVRMWTRRGRGQRSRWYNRRLDTERPLDVVPSRDRLESWKEIAAYLNRSERTVRRWEDKEGLPVHRLQHDKRGSVYAYASELDAWRGSRRQLLEVEPPDVRLLRRRFPAAWGDRGAPRSGDSRDCCDRRCLAHQGSSGSSREDAQCRSRSSGRASELRLRRGPHADPDGDSVPPGSLAPRSRLCTSVGRPWDRPPGADLVRRRPSSRNDGVGERRGAGGAAAGLISSAAAWRGTGVCHTLPRLGSSDRRASLHKAIALEPDDAIVLSWFGDFLTDLRRFDEARAYFKRAQDASPRWLEPSTFSANIHQVTGNPDLAIAEHRRVLESEPSFGLGNIFRPRWTLRRATTHSRSRSSASRTSCSAACRSRLAIWATPSRRAGSGHRPKRCWRT